MGGCRSANPVSMADSGTLRGSACATPESGSSDRVAAMKWGRAALALAAAVTVLVAVVAGGGQARAPRAQAAAKGIQTGSGPFNVVIRRTAHGVPHILAADWRSLGYGYGYAFAQDNLCTIAESYVPGAARRPRSCGPAGGWTSRGNGWGVNTPTPDFFSQRANASGIGARRENQPPPLGPKPEIREGVRGYV